MAEELLERLRPKAFAVAYRMLGSVGEAEDIVQEALLRVHQVLRAGERIESPQTYVATVVTRLAIDELRSARVRRETYVGEWLPEPLLADEAEDPAERAEMADSLSFAFLVLLESLSPEQRAVFLLHDVFGYAFAEVAAIVGKSEATCRQLASRARRHLRERTPRFEPRSDDARELADRFFAAVQHGDLDGLEALLARDASLHGDGGGNAPAVARPLQGRARVAHALLGWTRAGERFGGFTVRRVDVNGQPGAVNVDAAGRVISVMALDIRDGRIQAVRAIVNPDKLRHVGPVADLRALLRGRDAEAARRSGGGRRGAAGSRGRESS
ncbi:MAG TPA: RNA polymerase sigma-70 factor [Longimicrobiales bacterium]|nr:RNA polymerase sigma-70 factor [Longimicrobiales bacterium]